MRKDELAIPFGGAVSISGLTIPQLIESERSWRFKQAVTAGLFTDRLRV